MTHAQFYTWLVEEKGTKLGNLYAIDIGSAVRMNILRIELTMSRLGKSLIVL